MLQHYANAGWRQRALNGGVGKRRFAADLVNVELLQLFVSSVRQNQLGPGGQLLFAGLCIGLDPSSRRCGKAHKIVNEADPVAQIRMRPWGID